MPIELLRMLAILCALLAGTMGFAQDQLLGPRAEMVGLGPAIDECESVFSSSHRQPRPRVFPQAECLFSWMTADPKPTPLAPTTTEADTITAPSVFPISVVRQGELDPPLAPNQASKTLPEPIAVLPSESPQGLPVSACDHPFFSDSFFRFFREGIWYFSWGYSRESWAPTNIHVSQPSLHNNFTVYHVRATDDPSWDSAFSAQYNFRIGRFIDDTRTLAIELSFDHTKYTSVVGQTAHVVGTIAGKPVDANYQLNDSFFTYALHNGANHVMCNLAKFVPLIGEPNDSFSVAAVGKIGIGPMLPHAENEIMGQNVDVGQKQLNNLLGVHSGWWQLNGWTTGVEGGFRVSLTKAIYVELTDKVAYARLYDVPVYQGTACHNLWMNEVILTVGFTFGAH
jgi:hypothetical protein